MGLLWRIRVESPTMGCGNQGERWPIMDTMAHNGCLGILALSNVYTFASATIEPSRDR
jgi:hypothetical protein